MANVTSVGYGDDFVNENKNKINVSVSFIYVIDCKMYRDIFLSHCICRHASMCPTVYADFHPVSHVYLYVDIHLVSHCIQFLPPQTPSKKFVTPRCHLHVKKNCTAQTKCITKLLYRELKLGHANSI